VYCEMRGGNESFQLFDRWQHVAVPDILWNRVQIVRRTTKLFLAVGPSEIRTQHKKEGVSVSRKRRRQVSRSLDYLVIYLLSEPLEQT
jgi:hypothetical protein